VEEQLSSKSINYTYELKRTMIKNEINKNESNNRLVLSFIVVLIFCLIHTVPNILDMTFTSAIIYLVL
jgi:hypothetical protein